jgi:hypothetical protein
MRPTSKDGGRIRIEPTLRAAANERKEVVRHGDPDNATITGTSGFGVMTPEVPQRAGELVLDWLNF